MWLYYKYVLGLGIRVDWTTFPFFYTDPEFGWHVIVWTFEMFWVASFTGTVSILGLISDIL